MKFVSIKTFFTKYTAAKLYRGSQRHQFRLGSSAETERQIFLYQSVKIFWKPRNAVWWFWHSGKGHSGALVSALGPSPSQLTLLADIQRGSRKLFNWILSISSQIWPSYPTRATISWKLLFPLKMSYNCWMPFVDLISHFSLLSRFSYVHSIYLKIHSSWSALFEITALIASLILRECSRQ